MFHFPSLLAINHIFFMFIIKKIFNSNSKSDKIKKVVGSLEEDALPVDTANSSLILERNSSLHHHSSSSNSVPSEFNDVSFTAENNTTNVNNVSQQVVVQFSNINGLQIGSTYNINKNNTCRQSDTNNENDKSENKIKTKYPKTITIDAMMKSQDEPSRDLLNEIATHLGGDYKHFMRELGFSEGQISAKTIDHNIYGVKEVIYQLLLDWLRNADDEGTVGYLTTKLWNSGQRECVYRLKTLWKSKAFVKSNIVD